MYHKYLNKWAHENKVTYKRLAHLVGVTQLSNYTTTGKLFPAEWIEKWGKVFHWTDEERFKFQFDREYKPENKNAPKVIVMSLEDFQAQVMHKNQ